MAMKVAGSVGAVLKSMAEMSEATTSDSTAPTAMPMSASHMVRKMTPNCTRNAVAPSAMRMPISSVCRVTE
jgi:hypothetical protein